MIGKSGSLRRAGVLAFVLFIMAALAASADGSVTATTQRYPANVDIAPGDNVHGEAYVLGRTPPAYQDPTGTIQFYVCFRLGATGTNYPTCEATTDGTALGGPVAVGGFQRYGDGTTSKTVSPDYASPIAGTYCFLAVYTPTSGNGYPGLTAGANLDQNAECGAIVGLTAVTLASMGAQSIDNGMGWAMPSLGALGVVTLGGLLFVAARKR